MYNSFAIFNSVDKICLANIASASNINLGILLMKQTEIWMLFVLKRKHKLLCLRLILDKKNKSVVERDTRGKDAYKEDEVEESVETSEGPKSDLLCNQSRKVKRNNSNIKGRKSYGRKRRGSTNVKLRR